MRGELASPVRGGGGEETTGRKAGIGASPPTLRVAYTCRGICWRTTNPTRLCRCARGNSR